MHLQEQSVDGLFDSLTKLVSGGAKFTTNLATQVVQGKQAYDATKAAWKGVPYAPGPVPSTIAAPSWPGVPYAMPGGTGQRFTPGTSQIAAPVQERPLTKAEISEIQSTLNSMGYNTGKVDGLYGPNTAAGIRAFQNANSFAVTGQLSVALLQTVRNMRAQNATQIPPFVQSTPTPIYSPPYYVEPTPTPTPPMKTTEEKLWTWVIPGVAALGGLLLLMSQRGGRR